MSKEVEIELVQGKDNGASIPDKMSQAYPKINRSLQNIKEMVDDHEARLDEAEQVILDQAAYATGLAGRLDVAEPKITDHETRIDALEDLTTTHETRLDVAEPKIEDSLDRLQTSEQRLTLLEADSIDGEVLAARGGYGSLNDRLNAIGPGLQIRRKTFTTTAGQTVFSIADTGSYSVGQNRLRLVVGGVNQYPGIHYTETSSTSFTLLPDEPLPAGIPVFAEWYQGDISLLAGHNKAHHAGGGDELNIADLAGYDEITNLKSDVAQRAYNVKSAPYNAKGDGVTNDTAAIQAAIDAAYANGGGQVVIPYGNYRVTGDTLKLKNKVQIYGIGMPRIFTNSGVGYATLLGSQFNSTLTNIVVDGLFIDQWDEITLNIPNVGLSPKQMQAIAIYGASTDCIIRNCKIQGIGSWCIDIMDSDISHGGSGAIVENNVIYWKQARSVWYDASAIYVDNFNHRISNNYIETINTGLNERWRIEGGIETHGVGKVEGNTIINVQAGVNICPHTYHTPKNSNERYIINNNIINCDRGLWFWNYKFTNLADVGNHNIIIENNKIQVVRDGYYRGVGAIDSQMVQAETGHDFLGGMSNIKIINNDCSFEIKSAYTGSAYMDLLNSGALHIVSNIEMRDFKIMKNRIIGFPYPAIVTYVYNSGEDAKSRNFQMYENFIQDCGWDMPSSFDKDVFAITRVNQVDIRNNLITWKNKNTTSYLLNAYLVNDFWFEGNTQFSENSFTQYAVNATQAFLDDARNVIFAYPEKSHASYAGNPTGNVIPKFSGQDLLDTSKNRWYKAKGLTNNDWQLVTKVSGTAVPTSGTYVLGDVVAHPNPSYGKPSEWYCYSGGTPGLWTMCKQAGIGKGTTAFRPTGLTSNDVGVVYLDTSLATAGKSITWNGSAWVDATGATV